MLDETIADNEVLIDSYEIIRKDKNRHGEGVLLYIRDTINYKLRNYSINAKKSPNGHSESFKT